MTATILNFVRAPSNNHEAFNLAEWMSQCISAGYEAQRFSSLICAANLRALAEAFDGRSK